MDWLVKNWKGLVVAMLVFIVVLIILTPARSLLRGTQSAGYRMQAQQGRVELSEFEYFKDRKVPGQSVISLVQRLKTEMKYKVKVVVATNKSNYGTYSLAYYGWLNSTRVNNYGDMYADNASYRFFGETPTSTNVTTNHIGSTALNGASAKEQGTLTYLGYQGLIPSSGTQVMVSEPQSSFWINPSVDFLGSIVLDDQTKVLHTIIFKQQ